MPLLPTTPLLPSIRSTFRASRLLALACTLGVACLAQAQLFGNDDWKETEAPPPPAFNRDKLISIEMPPYMSLKFGVDPDTIKITPDGVVRYVVVATHKDGGGFNAFYEGLRCATAEYKSYARFNNGAWDITPSPDWKRLGDRNSIYTKALVNVISGVLTPDKGHVVVDGRDVTGKSSYTIARAGISRSFQTVRLFRALTVRDNIAAVVRGGAGLDRTVEGLMTRLRISHLADEKAGGLAYGLQRRVEIARALATDPRYLLLDEPAAGLNDVESDDLESIIRQVVDEFGCGVLIIDHDIRLITRLCHRLHVLSGGRTLAEGDPQIVRTDPEVVRAYLGDRAVAQLEKRTLADGTSS